MYYIVSEVCIDEHFLEDCFYYYSQQVKSAVANESLFPCNLIKRAPYFFWVKKYCLLTHIISNLKFLRSNENFFTKFIIYQQFQQVTYLLLVFVRLQTLVVFFFFFFCFSAFCEFQCHFYKSTFALTFMMKYFTSFRFEGG